MLSLRKYAESRKARRLPGGSLSAVQRAVTAGRIKLVDGKIDPRLADRDWRKKTNPLKQANAIGGPTAQSRVVVEETHCPACGSSPQGQGPNAKFILDRVHQGVGLLAKLSASLGLSPAAVYAIPFIAHAWMFAIGLTPEVDEQVYGDYTGPNGPPTDYGHEGMTFSAKEQRDGDQLIAKTEEFFGINYDEAA